jgi:subtilisin family serine protease
MKLILFATTIFFGLNLQAQSIQSASKKEVSTDKKRDWHNLDYKSDKVYGTSTNRTYAELIGDQKPKKKIVVAVIDSGVDFEHEDLKTHLWINRIEIALNGKDDDGNGYIDDVHGWNFLIDENNEDIQFDNLEATRVLRLSKQIKESNGEYPDWLTNEVISQAVEIYNENVEEYKGMEQMANFYVALDSILTVETGTESYTFDQALALPHDEDPMKSIHRVIKAFSLGGITQSDLIEMYETSEKFEKYYLNYDFVARPDFDVNEPYGNNNYEGPDAIHGTHVAGLIAADRNNELGARGIASDCVEIMILRAVPDGDERDEDVASAIRYAVDNGANIINMSFGKGLSPNKELVDEAIRYASENNVLIIHAAGNDSENNDEVANFPNPIAKSGYRSPTYMTIGASSISRKKDLVANFSNFGQQEVDLFSPGHDVYSTVPFNEYKLLSGTSMAAPVASGVAALVWAYHPDLSAVQLKEILSESSVDLSKKKVKRPSDGKKVKFGTLSRTGGIINAYNAFKLADTYSN